MSSRTTGQLAVKRSPPNFFDLVYETVREIPQGRVTTYSSIAKYLGNPRGSRAVGWAMRVCNDPDVPSHRVLRLDGRVSGDPDDVKKRIAKLRREKVVVKDQCVQVSKYFYDDFMLTRTSKA